MDLDTGNVRDLERFAGAPAKKRSAYLVRFTRDGQKIVFSHNLDKIDVFDVKADKVVKSIPVPVWIRSIAVGPSPNLAAAGCEDGTVRIIDLTSGAVVKELTGHREAVGALAWSEDGKSIISASLEIKVWGLK
jgi:WD40 repeat protein